MCLAVDKTNNYKCKQFNICAQVHLYCSFTLLCLVFFYSKCFLSANSSYHSSHTKRKPKTYFALIFLLCLQPCFPHLLVFLSPRLRLDLSPNFENLSRLRTTQTQRRRTQTSSPRKTLLWTSKGKGCRNEKFMVREKCRAWMLLV